MKELFKELEFKGRKFTVGDKGTIYLDDKLVNQVLNHDGYFQIPFKANYGLTTVGVHRLVALAFVPNPDPNIKVEVNHKDYDRKNNCKENLEWVTHKENIEYSINNYKHNYGDKNPNYGNRKLSEFYKLHPEISKLKQSRKGIQNGRCRKIELYFHGKYIKTFDYIDLCSKYLVDHGVTKAKIVSIRSRIDSSIRNNKPYKGYTFKKI